MPVGILDLYEEIRGMRKDVSEVMVTLAVLKDSNLDGDAIHNDHEIRLRIVEKFKHQIIGALILANAATVGFSWVIYTK